MANPVDSIKGLPPWGKAAVAVGGLGVGWLIWRQHGAGAAASTAQSGMDPVTGLPYSMDGETDPETGLAYLAEAQEFGSVQAAESQFGLGAGAAPGSELSGGFPVTAGSAQPLGTTSGYGTNAQWAQAAQAGLETIGYSATDVAAALGDYLSHLPLTSSQAGIVYAAIAEYGDPPAGTYQVLLQPATATGPASTGSAPAVVVPHVDGMQVNAAVKEIEDAGLAAHVPPRNPADTYVVNSQTPEAGTHAAKGSTVDLGIAPHTFTTK